MAHTKGPWSVSQQLGLRLFIVADDEAIAEILPCNFDAEQFANADLMVSAPELLEALEIAVQCCACTLKQRDSGHLVECFAPKAIEVIRKAKHRMSAP
jgi:hypothetical protein